MPGAARFLDSTSHPGMILGGASNVFINLLPAARVTDKHACMLPPSAGPHPPSTIVEGSKTVFIEGQPAARMRDKTGCGAVIVSGSIDVFIGG
jgi:uncharacterized Zn-binding protein involved in type VI secretion